MQTPKAHTVEILPNKPIKAIRSKSMNLNYLNDNDIKTKLDFDEYVQKITDAPIKPKIHLSIDYMSLLSAKTSLNFGSENNKIPKIPPTPVKSKKNVSIGRKVIRSFKKRLDFGPECLDLTYAPIKAKQENITDLNTFNSIMRRLELEFDNTEVPIRPMKRKRNNSLTTSNTIKNSFGPTCKILNFGVVCEDLTHAPVKVNTRLSSMIYSSELDSITFNLFGTG